MQTNSGPKVEAVSSDKKCECKDLFLFDGHRVKQICPYHMS